MPLLGHTCTDTPHIRDSRKGDGSGADESGGERNGYDKEKWPTAPGRCFFFFGSPGLQLYIAAEQLRASVRPEQVVKLLRAGRCAL